MNRACNSLYRSASTGDAAASRRRARPSQSGGDGRRRAQTVDLAVAGLERGLQSRLSRAALRVTDLGARLRPPERRLAEVGAELTGLGSRLDQQIDIQLDRRRVMMDSAVRLLEANSFERVLERGFALVTTPEGLPIKRAAEAAEGAEVTVGVRRCGPPGAS